MGTVGSFFQRVRIGKMCQKNRIFLLRWLLVVVVVAHTGSLLAQPKTDPNHRNRYLLTAPPIPIAQASATEPNVPSLAPTLRNLPTPPIVMPTNGVPTNNGAPVNGVATLPKRTLSFAEINAVATHNHPGVQQAKRQAEALRGEWIQAGLRSGAFSN